MVLRRKARTKRAFTLVELLVVIAIIGVLVSLLLPAVQAAREASRRSACGNNIKQLGLALHNYHDTNRKFPMAGYLTAPPVTSSSSLPYHHTWLTSLLPFMEQSTVYDATNMNLPAWGQAIVSAQIPILRCPSDGGYTGAPAEHHGIALTNYSGSEGYHWWPEAYLDPGWGGTWTQLPKAGDYTGLFAVTRLFDMSSISDGTSNTVVAAETDSYGSKWGAFQTSGTGARRARGGEAVFRSAFVYTAVNGGAMFAPYQSPSGGSATEGTWFRAGPHSYCPSYLTAWGLNTEWPGASSNHSGGIVQGLRGDASVGTYVKNINWGVWVAINGVGDAAVVQAP